MIQSSEGKGSHLAVKEKRSAQNVRGDACCQCAAGIRGAEMLLCFRRKERSARVG